jgi:hypothetical protein
MRIFLNISSSAILVCLFLQKKVRKHFFSGVGKSCLLLQFTDKRFQPVHDLTIGKRISFNKKNNSL